MGAQALAKMGRPTAFNKRMANRVLALAAEGLTSAQIAEEIGVPVRTFNNWLTNHKDFHEAVNASKAIADELIVAALFQRAMGYSHPAVKILSTKEGIEVVPYTEHYPPDPTSMIFWLKNRQPKKWRDAQRLEVDNVSKAEALPTPAEAIKILEADFAVLPAKPVVIEDL